MTQLLLGGVALGRNFEFGRFPMSQERFIRCKHCGLPHEADRTTCPVTGKDIQGVRRSVPPPAFSPPQAPASNLRPVVEPVEEEDSPSVARFRGKLVDDTFRIDELIDKGGMAAVYRAEHTRLGKQVTIEGLLRGHTHGSAVEGRFLREARAAGPIGHPNIVEVFDVGYLDDFRPSDMADVTAPGLSVSAIRGPGEDDPTGPSDSVSHADRKVPKFDDSSSGSREPIPETRADGPGPARPRGAVAGFGDRF